MAGFLFNFSIQSEDGADQSASDIIPQNAELDKIHGFQSDAFEIHPPVTNLDKNSLDIKTFHYKDIKVKYLNPSMIEDKLKQSKEGDVGDVSIVHALNSNTDLIPSVYEGGLKLWECSFDLVTYLVKSNMSFQDKHVLELGCGAGLPGIYSLLCHPKQVIFQDYNSEVLELMTIPTVRLNCPESIKKCRFIAGDWGAVDESFIGNNSIDVILTSETIYNTDSVPRLYQLMKRVISKTGVIYVAAKTHYFGVGGGTGLFEELVKQKGDFKISSIEIFDDGLKREIMQLQLKEKG